jgi:hypothetical protein
MFTKRLVASAILAGSAAISLVAAPAMAQATTPAVTTATAFPQAASAQAGAAWLASQLTPAGYVASTTTPGTADLSATANTVLALASTGTDPTGVDAALTYLAANVNAYVQTAGVDGPGQLALLILDAHALGRNPFTFGGTNLVTRLLATQQTTGPDAGLFGTEAQAAGYDAGNYQQGLALAALAAAGVTGTTAVKSAIAWLDSEQCADGGWTTPDNANNACSGTPATYEGPDTNSTALALQGLAAQSAVTSSIATSATSFLTVGQDSDGGFSYYPNSAAAPQSTDPNSTALVIQALVSLGSSPTATLFQKGTANPVTALTSFQIASGTGSGAFTYPGTPGPDLLATYQAVPAIAGVTIPFLSILAPRGYWLAAADGGIFSYGATFQGSHGGSPLNKPIVGIASTPDGNGYWLVASDGGVFSYGDASFYGSHGGSPLNQPVVGIASTPDGKGYWLVAADGGIFSYGDATFYGSHGGSPLNKPVVGIASTPDGKGYWLVASDGGIFSYGDATFYGSHGGSPLNKPVVGIASTPDGKGYWLVASDGGIFSYGDATFQGSHGGSPLNKPVVGIASTPDGKGYWLVASDGGIFSYGDATFQGSHGGSPLNQPVVGIATGVAPVG